MHGGKYIKKDSPKKKKRKKKKEKKKKRKLEGGRLVVKGNEIIGGLHETQSLLASI